MKALSLWQPWAHLLAVGAKRYETRDWATRYRGPIAIHAAKRWTVRMAVQCYQEPFFTILSRAGIKFPAHCDARRLKGLGLDFGAIIGVGVLADCRPANEVLREIGGEEVAFGDFSHGRYAFEYQDVRQLPTPIPLNGQQGLWDLPDDIISQIERTASWEPLRREPTPASMPACPRRRSTSWPTTPTTPSRSSGGS